MKKGSNCSISGITYEKQIYNILNRVTINDIKFNDQNILELGGSSSRNDIICKYKNTSFGIEIKKHNTPDWMQCSLKKDIVTGKWTGSNRCKISDQCKKIFDELLDNKNLFNNTIPPFINNKLTYYEWTSIKNKTDLWNDQYFDIPNNTILKLYNLKGCSYIQISEYGLYHLGNDICNFNVPEFIIDQQLRIRIKVHKCSNKINKYCSLSITASCKPKNIKQLNKSSYSLDDINTLPQLCIYNDNL